MLVFGQIRIRLEIGIRVTTILGFQYRASTRLRYQWNDESRIGTLIHQILLHMHSSNDLKTRHLLNARQLGSLVLKWQKKKKWLLFWFSII